MQSPYFLKKNIKTYKMLKDLIVNAKKLNIKFLVLPLVDNGSLKTKKIEKKFTDMTLKLHKKLLNNKVKIIFESDFHPHRLLSFINKNGYREKIIKNKNLKYIYILPHTLFRFISFWYIMYCYNLKFNLILSITYWSNIFILINVF